MSRTPTRPQASHVQRRTGVITAAIVLAGAIAFVLDDRGFVLVLTGLCATLALVIGMSVDAIRR